MSITPASLFSGQLYQLPGSSASTQQGDTSGNANTQASAVESLLSALDPSSNASPQGDLLDLSPQAQSLLNGFGLAGSGGTATVAGQSTGSGFLLTPQQQQKISDILAKYKDAPFTQATYAQIQQDLQAAGLSPDQLALQDDLRSFNSTGVLLDALNGKQDPVTNPISNGTEQSNANAYMQQIYNQWQSISTTAGAA